jgi:hypothetical protein
VRRRPFACELRDTDLQLGQDFSRRALGGQVEQCNDCGLVQIAYNSCRDRHCPKCQSLARAQWVADRRADLLPVPYFHVVFTVPAPIVAVALQNKAVVAPMATH